MDGVWLGAGRDLAGVVETHLFGVAPNNSGSTFLMKALATCRQTWSLPLEGQFTFGFAGPNTEDHGRLLWSHEPWRSRLADPAACDWPRNRAAWYFQASARDPHASVFFTKAPPFLLQVGALRRHFRNAKFLFMVRNPYAVCEGICRSLRLRHAIGLPVGREAAQEGVRLEILAARHVATCLEYQRRNVEAFGERDRLITYEAMCAEPERTARTIRELAPTLDDLNLRQRLPVHQSYHEMLTDMNARQIARLAPGQVAAINRVFRRHRAVLEHFGYEIMDRSP